MVWWQTSSLLLQKSIIKEKKKWTIMIQIKFNHNIKTTFKINLCLDNIIWIKIQILYSNSKCKITWICIETFNKIQDSTKCLIMVNINLFSQIRLTNIINRHITIIFKIPSKSKKDLKNLKNRNNKIKNLIRSKTFSRVITKMEYILITFKSIDFVL